MKEVDPKPTDVTRRDVLVGASTLAATALGLPNVAEASPPAQPAEHQVVRKNVGMFDISHMGQFIVSGNDVCDWLNRMLTNNVAKLEVGQGQYTFLLNDNGGVIDDLILYRLGKSEFLLVVNASKIEEDFAWLERANGRRGPR